MSRNSIGSKPESKISLCIPLYKELPLLRLQRKYSEKFGVPLQFLFDEKILRKKRYLWVKFLGKTFANSGNSIEQGYENFVLKASSSWVLRIDSDEILNGKSIQYLNELELKENHVVGFLRYQVVLIGDDFYVLANSEFDPNQHVQWRLFNKKFGKFGSETIHNPGFELIGRNPVLAPKDCFIYHLDFVIRDQKTRASKSLRYSELGQENHMERFQILPENSWQLMPILDLEILDFLNQNIRLIKKIRAKASRWENFD